ncbi:hypothetical protein ONZ45_g17940 [Pleurotus djamor]|nr:hypothetical protein ONZ45_g17940 [Pleurotus djamor]
MRLTLSIQKKLCESGWGPEIAALTEHQLGLLKKCPSAKVARPLTDRTWKKIEPEFASLMKSFREERLKTERAAILTERRQLFAEAVKGYYSTQPWDSILPSVADLDFLPSFSAFKKQIEEDPNEVEYTSLSFDAILLGMPRYCQDWKAEFTEAVLEVANEPCITKKDNPPITYDVETLHLARTVFMCSQCNDPLQYPYILTHGCFRPTPWRHRRAPKMDQATMDMDTIAWKEVFPCNLDLLPLAPMIAIIKACGCDPEIATAADMDAVNAWLVRHYPNSPPEVMRWRKAVSDIHISIR